MAYSEKVVDHYENPRNVGSFDKLTDWREFGEENFEFEILDQLEPLDTPDYKPADDLKVLEAIWLDKLQPFEPAGYNPVKTGSRQ